MLCFAQRSSPLQPQAQAHRFLRLRTLHIGSLRNLGKPPRFLIPAVKSTDAAADTSRATGPQSAPLELLPRSHSRELAGSSTDASSPTLTPKRIVVIGSGWAGYTFLRNLNQEEYTPICISPKNHFVFTPLLASSAVGTLEFRSIVEPVKRLHDSRVEYFRANCTSIDFDRRVVICETAKELSETEADGRLEVPYDMLVIAPGAQSHTFGIQGVREHALFLKEIADARKIRTRLMDCFDKASLANTPESEIDRLLHFQIVGGGPTGVEFSAELHDFLVDDLAKLYPSLVGRARITLYDVAPRILGAFDAALAAYATRRFERVGVTVRTGTRVDLVNEREIHVNGGERVPYGLLVWATGITQTPLVQNLLGRVYKDDKNLRRLVTDDKLRLLAPSGTPFNDVYALGDCAVINTNNLPATAQVANQKALYLAKQLSKPAVELPAFKYRHMGSMAYIGNWRAVVDMSNNNTTVSGTLAWLMWRSVYLSKSLSWRNRFMISVFWIGSWLFGREISRIK